jgi:hypothetical protein
MYVYIHSDTDSRGNWLWTVGFYDPAGKWHAETDHDNKEAAAERVHWLNGGQRSYLPCGVNAET